jgi:hypothetical protein
MPPKKSGRRDKAKVTTFDLKPSTMAAAPSRGAGRMDELFGATMRNATARKHTFITVPNVPVSN